MTTQLLENRYRIVQELGQGGFGETFLAEDLHMPSSRRCVIKQLKPVTNDPAVYQLVKDRFQREAVILERLGEGNRQIPSLFAYFTEGGQFYLVQEWIEGETLSQNLERQGGWSSAAVTQLLVGLLPVLDFIHDQGIVHRDLKPDNIILRRGDQSPVLIDFGAVKETMGTQMNSAGQSTSSIVIGTPGFMPSEQAIGRPVFSSDLYSLGLTAIYLLTGKLPGDFMSDPVTGKLLWRSPNVNVDPHLAEVIDQAIAPHPRDRFTTAGAMLRALQSVHSASMPTVPLMIQTPDTALPTSVPAPMPSTQPTVVSAESQSTPLPQAIAPPVAPNKAMADWQKAILTGGVIGAFLLGGIVLSDLFVGDRQAATNEAKTQPEEVVPAGEELPEEAEPEENEKTPVTPPVEPPEPTTEKTPEKTVEENTPVTNLPPVQPIDEYKAEAIVADWLRCKTELFDNPYDRYCGKVILTGTAYQENIERNDGKLSSVEWLENNGSYYVFENQQIDEIVSFQLNGRNATIQLVVTEKRTLYDANDNVDTNASGYDQRLVKYDMEFTEDGLWKISDYRTLEVLAKK